MLRYTLSVRTALRLRKAESGEADTLTKLAIRSKQWWGYDDAFMDKIRDDMVVAEEWLLRDHAVVAEDNGMMAGYAISRVDAREAFLRDLFIDPPFIGRGIGSVLFEDALAFARAQRVNRLTLIADPNAVGFYERYGLRVVGREPSSYIPGRSLPIMAMELL
jgi:ribosomal protein S18 acetylase RimI-like enzyme